jgi:predicted short-subunit dehydrogenase-like oxidoreductase (DUF2520 family)
MIQVVLLGSGNVATHLYQAFQKTSEVEVIQVFTRNQSLDFPSTIQVHSYNQLMPADVYIISVTDLAIAEVSKSIPFENQLVVHTSGTSALDVLDTKNRRGVFYPLQTFSKVKKVDFSEIPLCLETEFEEDYAIIEKMALSISKVVQSVSSDQRKALHVAAVFSCNFVNHLYQIGSEICENNDIPFSILFPLIKETAAKIETLTPIEAQTGPAIRRDEKTISKHLDFLQDKNQKEIYQLLTQSIQNVKKL